MNSPESWEWKKDTDPEIIEILEWYEQYFKIHFLRSMLSKKYIVECLADNKIDNIEDYIGQLDEENQIYYRAKMKEILDRFKEED